jgi:hypothetical protein
MLSHCQTLKSWGVHAASVEMVYPTTRAYWRLMTPWEYRVVIRLVMHPLLATLLNIIVNTSTTKLKSSGEKRSLCLRPFPGLNPQQFYPPIRRVLIASNPLLKNLGRAAGGRPGLETVRATRRNHAHRWCLVCFQDAKHLLSAGLQVPQSGNCKEGGNACVVANMPQLEALSFLLRSLGRRSGNGDPQS